MSGLLGLSTLRMRVERHFQFQALHLNRYREELMRVARTLVDEGFFETPSPKGPLRVAFPAKVHEFYFPQLFLDLPVESPAQRAN